jgi:hypothetical protein
VSALPVEHSGLASGVLNSARQVGTAIGLAALGSVGLAVSRSSWAAQSAQLPTSAHAAAPDVVQDVSGGEGSVVAQQLGAAAKPLVDSAFVDGLHVALLIGGGLMLVAAAFAFTVLRQPAVTPRTRSGARLLPTVPPTRPQAESRTVLAARPAIVIVHRRWRDHLAEC